MKKSSKAILRAAVMLVVIAGIVFVVVISGNDGKAASTRTDESVRRISVAAMSPRPMVFEERIAVSGNVEARNTALVSARIAGPIDAIYVEEGSAVQVGKTRLFQTDSLKSAKAVEIVQHNMAVAQCALREVQAREEQVKTQYDLDRSDLERYKGLLKTGGATEHELESQTSKFLQSDASLKHAEAAVELARAQLELVKSQLAMARKDLSDTLVIAPISGCVSSRFHEPGERAEPGTPILRIDDLSVVEVSAYLPESYYDRIVVGQTKVRMHIGDKSLGECVLSYKGPVVNRRLRTFEIKTALKPVPAGIVPGRLVKLTVIINSHRGLGLPADAALTRGGQVVVFVVDDGKAREAPVTLGLETDGMIEVTSANLSSDSKVVVKSQRFCDDGSPLTIVRDNN